MKFGDRGGRKKKDRKNIYFFGQKDRKNIF